MGTRSPVRALRFWIWRAVEGRELQGIGVRVNEALGPVVVEPERVRGQRVGRGAGRDRVARARRGHPEAIHDEGAARHVVLHEALGEVEDLLDAHGRGRRDEDERHLGGSKRSLHHARALLEAAEEVIQLADELCHRLEEAASRDLADAAEDDRRGAREEVEGHLAGGLEGVDEPAHGLRVERLDQALRGASRKSRAFAVGGVSRRMRS